MQNSRLDSVPFPEPAHQLRRQADFGHEYEHLTLPGEDICHDPQIDFCLAAAGDAVEQEGGKALIRKDSIDGVLLMLIQLRSWLAICREGDFARAAAELDDS